MDFRIKWNQFASSGVAIFAIAVTFMVNLPGLSTEQDSKIDWFVKFLIACMIALFTIPFLKKSKPSDSNFWYRFACITLLLAIVSVATYTFSVNNWSVPWYKDKRLVIGKTMNRIAVVIKKTNDINDEKLVKMRLGDTKSIWPEKELQTRFFFLLLLYILSFLLVAGFIISVIQAIYCYESAK
jgi:hypothetical protein